MSLIASFANLGSNLQLKPFDTSSEEGRTRERQRRALLTIIADVFSKGCGLIVLILTLRISLPYLGQERYGILATVISFTNILVALDLGVGNALIGQVAKGTVADQENVSSLVSRGFWVLVAVGTVVGGLLLLLSRWVPIAWAFKGASAASLAECRGTLALFAVLFASSIPLGALRNVYFGLQRGYVVHLVSAIAAVASLLLLFLVVRFHAGMSAFLFAGYGIRVLSGLALLVPFLLRGQLTGFRWDYLYGQETRGLLGVGGLFFLLQIGTMAGWGADPLILSSRIGPLAVVIFTLADRATQLISIPLFILNKPFWATYAEALARGDKAYIRRTLKLSLTLTTLIAVVIAMFLFFARTPIFRFLSKDVVEVPAGFLAAYLLWTIIRSLGDSLAMYMNGVHVLRSQVILLLLFIVVSIPAKIIFASTSSLVGFVVASIMSYILASVVPTFTIFRKNVFAAISIKGNSYD